MNKKAKTTLQFILAGTMLVSFAVTGCNNDSEKKEEAAKDSVTSEKSMEAAPVTPAASDTTKKRDTASTRPTVPGS